MRVNVLKILTVSGLAIMLAAQCGGSEPATGRLNLAVTDAPVDYAAEVVVTFVSASLRGPDGVGGSGPILIPEEYRMVYLMDYQGTDKAVLVSGLELPAGKYKVRLDADLTFTDTEQLSWIAFDGNAPECLDAPAGVVWAGTGTNITCRYPLQIPSEYESGFKPKGDVVILPDGTSSFTVEFDLRKNMVDPMDQEIFYRLKPTGVRLVDDTTAGTIEGTVDSDFLDTECGGTQAYVYLFDRTDSVDAFIPDDIHDGNTSYVTSVPVMEAGGSTHTYLAGFIPPGVYGLALTCDEDNPGAYDNLFFATQVDAVAVTAGGTTIQELPPVE